MRLEIKTTRETHPSIKCGIVSVVCRMYSSQELLNILRRNDEIWINRIQEHTIDKAVLRDKIQNELCANPYCDLSYENICNILELESEK